MVYLAAYASLRPEEQAELRRPDVIIADELEARRRKRAGEHEPVVLRISRASPELATGKRVTGEPKSRAGKRTVVLPAFLSVDVRRHLRWYAAQEPDGLLFVGEARRAVPPVDLRSEVAQGTGEGRAAGQLPLLRPSAHRQHAGC